jgi:hypothetical protein
MKGKPKPRVRPIDYHLHCDVILENKEEVIEETTPIMGSLGVFKSESILPLYVTKG